MTADHGNADEMLEPDGSPDTAHSTNPVPLIVTVEGVGLHEGVLADVAPTALELLGIEEPAAMAGGRWSIARPGRALGTTVKNRLGKGFSGGVVATEGPSCTLNRYR